MTINIEIEYMKRIERENEKLKNHMAHLESEKRYWLDNFKRLRDDNIKLNDENKQLQQSKLKETDFYIKALKNQLFNAYLIQQHNERLIAELKEALSSYNNFVDVMFPD